MIYLYTGTPGSGKSYHALNDIYSRLLKGSRVLANFPINCSEKNILKGAGEFYYLSNNYLVPETLYKFAEKYHVAGKEGQSLVVIDEAQTVFNSRTYQQKGQKEWAEFMQTHRHYGYNLILICQNDRMIDRQIRVLAEVEVKHRKVNNFAWFIPWPVFMHVKNWYGANRVKIGQGFTVFSKRKAMLYDSFIKFDNLRANEVGVALPGSLTQLAREEQKKKQSKKLWRKLLKLN